MKRILILAALVLMSATAFSQEVDPKSNPGSIYGSSNGDAYLDRVARKKGDLLLVVIDETSASTFSANTTTSKSLNNSTAANVLNAFNALLGPFTSTATHTNDGKGSTNQASNMSARVSVTVKSVDSAGNLFIEGTRSLITNKETQTFILTGVVRPFDISPDNTVPSSKIANASIQMGGKGQVADRQRKGFLTTILDWLF